MHSPNKLGFTKSMKCFFFFFQKLNQKWIRLSIFLKKLKFYTIENFVQHTTTFKT